MAALRAFHQTFREPDLMPDEVHGWATMAARFGRYAVFRGLYNNNLYWNNNPISASYKQNFALFQYIDGLYSPYYRLVELITAKTMGGALDWDALKVGAIPVTDADDTLIEALIQLWKWSKWGQNKTLYARLCAMLGDCGLWVNDDPARGRVSLEVLDPAKIKDATFDSVGNVIGATIEYPREWENPLHIDARTGRPETEVVTYRMEVDKSRFATYKDDKPFAWQTDASGAPVTEWENPYGFVPLAIANFKDLGLRWGAACLHAGIPKINAINDVSSIRNIGTRKAADPIWYGAGVDATDLQVPEHERDDAPIIGGPEGTALQSLAPDIDFAGIGSAIDSMLMELEKDAPELAMHRLRDIGAGVSGVAVRNMFSDATGRLIEAMGNLDDALIRASQMGISIGAFRRYDGFRAYSLDSYKNGALDFQIRERELFEEGFSPQERVAIIQSLPDNPAAAEYILLNELQMSEEDARAILEQRTHMVLDTANAITVGSAPVPQLGQGTGEPAQGVDLMADVQAILDSIGVE